MAKNIEVNDFLRLDGGLYIVEGVDVRYDPRTGKGQYVVFFNKWPKDAIKGSHTHRRGKILMSDIVQAPKYKFEEIVGDEVERLVRSFPDLADWGESEKVLLPIHFTNSPELGDDFYFAPGRVLSDRPGTTPTVADYGRDPLAPDNPFD